MMLRSDISWFFAYMFVVQQSSEDKANWIVLFFCFQSKCLEKNVPYGLDKIKKLIYILGKKNTNNSNGTRQFQDHCS